MLYFAVAVLPTEYTVIYSCFAGVLICIILLFSLPVRGLANAISYMLCLPLLLHSVFFISLLSRFASLRVCNVREVYHVSLYIFSCFHRVLFFRVLYCI